MKWIFFITLFSMLTPLTPAWGQVSSNFGGANGGAVVIGASTSTCNSTIEGALRYNSATPMIEFCDGTSWSSPCSSCDVYTFAAFAFVQANTSTVTTSEIMPINTNACSSDISISGGSSSEYRICNDDTCTSVDHTWSASAGNIDNGQYVQLRQTSSSTEGDIDIATLSIGSTLSDWSLQACPTSEYCGGRPDLKLAFVTSSKYNGDLEQEATDLGLSPSDGIDAADKICQKHADDEGLAGTYMAWIATATASNDDPNDRFTIAGTDLPFYKRNKIRVDDDWSDLVSGSIDNAINRYETNASPGSPLDVWTNVNTIGNAYHNTYHCSNWTSTSGSGYTGRTFNGSATWTLSSTKSCSGSYNLYCFEQ